MLYGNSGFLLSNTAKFELDNVVAGGSLGNGINRLNAMTYVERLCRVWGNSNDGQGQHSGAPPTGADILGVSFDPWCHDNWDDGDSIHEKCQTSVFGGLWEYNGDRGFVPSYGGHARVFNGIARYNGRMAIDLPGVSTFQDGAGFLFTQAPAANSSSVGGNLELFGCISEGNPINFAVDTVNNRLLAERCVSRSPVTASGAGTHFYTYGGGVMDARNCQYSGAGTVRAEFVGGVVNVANDSALA
ncbi:hypothetical protein WAE61_22575 [Comamonadaceae bacterium PP-2]